MIEKTNNKISFSNNSKKINIFSFIFLFLLFYSFASVTSPFINKAEAVVLPSIFTMNSTAINSTTVQLEAAVDAGYPLTQQGFCYGLDPEPGTTGGGVCKSTPIDPNYYYTYTGTLTNLTCNTQYFYRGYGVNSAGTGYDDFGWLSFRTGTCYVPPSLTSPTYKTVTGNTAVLGASLNASSGITARGTCWGTISGSTNNCLAEGSTAAGTFTHTRTGLPCGTTIYFVGYADNAGGSGYSPQSQFNTSACIPVPTLSSPTDTSPTTSSAILGATLGSGSGVTERGTCWGTVTDPTTNCLAEGGTTTGAFSHTRTYMSCGTTFYYRGYADNGGGRGYSPTTIVSTVSCP